MNKLAQLILPVLGLMLLDRFQREERRSQDAERTLMSKLGNPGFSPAAGFVMQLYREGRLSGAQSIIRGKNLMGANWQHVILPKADFEGADLRYVNLSQSNLMDANLNKVDFHHANLSDTDMRLAKAIETNFFEANLRRANLIYVDAKRASFFMAKAVRANMSSIRLTNADLAESDFHGVDLSHADLTRTLLRDTNFAETNLSHAILEDAAMMNANLRGADLTGTHFNNSTILPDAKFLHMENDRAIYDRYWSSSTDMTRYTNPEHPDFWQPEWALSRWVQKNYEDDAQSG